MPQDQGVATACELARRFQRHGATEMPDTLDRWPTAFAAVTVPEFKTFAAGLQQDYAAVREALRDPWSTGPVKAHVNPVKLVKRQMFGVRTSISSGNECSMLPERAHLLRENHQLGEEAQRYGTEKNIVAS